MHARVPPGWQHSCFWMFPTKRRLNHCIEGGRGSSQFSNLCFEQLFCLNMCHLSLLANLDWMGLLFLVDNDTSPLFGYQDFKRSVVEEWSLGSFLVTLHRKLWAFSHIIFGQVHKPGAVISYKVNRAVKWNAMYRSLWPLLQLHLGYVFFNLGWLVLHQVGHPNCSDSKATPRVLPRETLSLAFYAPNALGGTWSLASLASGCFKWCGTSGWVAV